ncbi:MAG: phosphoglycerate dehydrogenase [Acidobacteriota bacterium]|nr:phosphoglycerate dehydrogenase [Acidobacteriota bacterium]
MTQSLSLNKDKIRIVLLEGIHPHAVEVFNEHGYQNVELISHALTADALIDKIKDARLVGVRSRTQLTDEVLDKTKKLMAVGCFCIGTNQVSLDTAAMNGVPVFNAPHSNTRSVAELVVGQTIMLLRGIFPKSMAAHQQSWIKTAKGSHEVRGKVIGIVGYGHIGSQVSVLAEAMGMTIIYYDVQRKLPLGNARSIGSLEGLLEQADVVTLHVPQEESTRNLMSREMLERMKPGSHLINASRGNVVDIEALAELLRSDHIAGAAVDVFPVEPKSNKQAFESPLIGLPQVILTPHIGGSTQEAQRSIGHEVATRLIHFSDRGETDGSVNFPPVNLPEHEGSHRILHIHRNEPGMLRQINKALAEENINVLGQYLGTNNKIGYVVLDIAKDMSERLFERIRAVEGTIRCRMLY